MSMMGMKVSQKNTVNGVKYGLSDWCYLYVGGFYTHFMVEKV
jgi:hypothetical protein